MFHNYGILKLEKLWLVYAVYAQSNVRINLSGKTKLCIFMSVKVIKDFHILLFSLGLQVCEITQGLMLNVFTETEIWWTNGTHSYSDPKVNILIFEYYGPFKCDGLYHVFERNTEGQRKVLSLEKMGKRKNNEQMRANGGKKGFSQQVSSLLGSIFPPQRYCDVSFCGTLC